MTRWQRIKAFFGFYTPPPPPPAVGSAADVFKRPERRLKPRYGATRFIKPTGAPAPQVQRDHSADVLLGAAAGYALGSESHHESSSPTPTPTPSYSDDSSSSSSDSFSGGGGDFGGGGASGDFGGGSSD